MTARLVVEENKRFTKTLMDGYVVQMGRDPGKVDFVVPHNSLSRVHASFLYHEGKGLLQVRDENSRQGIRVDGKRVGEAVIASGQRVKCGDIHVLFESTREWVGERGNSGSPPKASRTRGKREIEYPERQPPLVPPEITRYKKTIEPMYQAELDRQKLTVDDGNAAGLEERVEAIVRRVVQQNPPPPSVSRDAAVKSIMEDLMGYGPLAPYLEDDEINEIMVNREDLICIERDGKMQYAGDEFENRAQLLKVIERIVSRVDRQINKSTPMVDAQLEDGSRVNAIIPPLALDGPCLTIRKFRKEGFVMEDLVENGTLSPVMAAFLRTCVENSLNVLISGGTGTGKTTLLNVLASAIPNHERIVTVEDTAELQLPKYHVIRMQSRNAGAGGRGEISIRDLVKNALRMRPDRIVVGECRGGEALDMVQAMNTGHDGSLTTIHANSPRDALRRLEVICMYAGVEIPHRAIREQIASAIDVIVQISRFTDGEGSVRKVTAISEVTGFQENMISLQDIFTFQDGGMDANHRRVGRHLPTGTIPSFVDDFRNKGIQLDLGMFRKSAGERSAS